MELNTDNLICAYNVLVLENWVTIDNTNITLRSKKPSPEALTIKEDVYQNLSKEAKEVIELVLDTPSEVKQYIQSPIRKKYSKGQIKSFLKKTWKGRNCSPYGIYKKIDMVMEELKNYTDTF